MAKAKAKKEAEAPEIIETVEEVAEVTAPNKAEEFVLRKLKVINRMENQAKAKRLANRLLRKRK